MQQYKWLSYEAFETYQFRDVTVKLIEQRSCLARKSAKPRQKQRILSGVSGRFEAGELAAIMGSSGSGKTTLLHAISGRLSSNDLKIEGEVLANGKMLNRACARSASAFVTQDDILLSTLTLRETINFSAIMRLPSKSLKMKLQRADEIIKKLKLEKCADTVVGSHLVKGLSGGEKRRCSIGVELVVDPPIIFVDEPTSGLDSSTAHTIVSLLREMAQEGKIVVCTIHSPSAKVFRLFSKLVILTDGRLAYIGSPTSCVEFFSKCGHICPALSCPADFFLMILRRVTQEDRDRVESIVAKFNSTLQRSNVSQQSFVSLSFSELQHFRRRFGARRPYCFQLKYLLKRAWLHEVRQPVNTVVRVLQNVLLSLFVGGLYWQTGNNQNSIYSRVGFLFFMVREFTRTFEQFNSCCWTLVLFICREKTVKMYKTSAYFLGKSLVESFTQTVASLLFGGIGYWMVGLKANMDSFLRYTLSMIVLANSSQSIGLLLGALVADPVAAVMLAPLVMIPFMLVTGFFINLASIPPFLAWLKVISPQQYVFSALMQTEFHGLQFECSEDELVVVPAKNGVKLLCPIISGEQVLQIFEFASAGEAASNTSNAADRTPFTHCIVAASLVSLAARIVAYLFLRFRSKMK